MCQTQSLCKFIIVEKSKFILIKKKYNELRIKIELSATSLPVFLLVSYLDSVNEMSKRRNDKRWNYIKNATEKRIVRCMAASRKVNNIFCSLFNEHDDCYYDSRKEEREEKNAHIVSHAIVIYLTTNEKHHH